MKLLYVSETSGIHDQRFIQAWKKNKFHVKSLSINFDGVIDNTELLQTIIEFQPDVIQVGPINQVASLVSQNWGGPLIVTSWGFDLMSDVHKSIHNRELAREILLRADLTFVDNDELVSAAVLLGASKNKVVKFPWGLDQIWLENVSISETYNHPPTYICTRNHFDIYHVEDVIRGFGLSLAPTVGSELKLVGSGPLTPHLKKVASELGLSQSIKFLGKMTSLELKNELNLSDVYISASETDGTSISLLEAMACNLPTIVSDIPGNKEWVGKSSGWTFNVNDIVGLSSVIDTFINVTSSNHLATLNKVKKARGKVLKKANWAITTSKFKDFAEDAILNSQERVGA